jgi:putative ABC transport system permease protein
MTVHLRVALWLDTMVMALGTIRANKMRSALTVLGIVIGIMSIVGMTSILNGFSDSFEALINTIGPNTVFVQRFGLASFGSGKDFKELMKRPNLNLFDVEAIERDATTLQIVDVQIGGGGPGRNVMERVFFKNQRSKRIPVVGTGEKFARVSFLAMQYGRFFNDAEVQHRRNVVVLGQGPYSALFQNTDPIGKLVRIGKEQFTVIGVFEKRPGLGGLNTGEDDFAAVPFTSYQKVWGLDARHPKKSDFMNVTIIALPKEGVSRDDAIRELRTLMRIRHELKLNQEDDFDIATQDVFKKFFDQVTKYIYLGLVVISSIALMVGGIGVMAIMTISVTERTREIGVRKALGARRREILWQFLLEAVVLTGLGGLIGILVGIGIAYAAGALTGLPTSLNWTPFAIGMGFSSAVGIIFGMVPAMRASRLDPIEALRYE